jgi:hypothetical protein
MEEKPEPSKWESTTTCQYLRWLFSSRILRRGLIALAWIVSLIALGYGVVDWRGRHAWNEYRQNFEAHVAPLDLQAYIPKPIPDSENFAAAPFVQSWVKTGINYDTNFLFQGDAYSRADQMIDSPKKKIPGRTFTDLVAWQEAFAEVQSHPEKPKAGPRSGQRAAKPKPEFQSDKLDLASRAQAAPAVLDGMKDDEAVLDEIRAASARPGCRYAVVYDLNDPWAILLPHLAKIKQTCQRLKIKACAGLAAGRNDDATDDVKLMFYLSDTCKTEPFLISYLVRLACMHIVIQPVWEGLAEHRWSDAQLQQLQARLSSFDSFADMQWPLHAECAAGALTTDLMKKKGLGTLVGMTSVSAKGAHDDSFLGDETVLNVLGRILPSGWYDMEKLNYCRLYEDLFHGTIDETAKRVFPDQIETNASKLEAVLNEPIQSDFMIATLTHGVWHAIIHHELIAAILLPSLRNIPTKAAAAQTAVDEAAIACALERCRLADGQFPENLEALIPRFAAHLPNDVITGEPFKYRRTDDGRFVLYSVGWNEKDDGGVSGKTQFDNTEGDWVWEYPAEK